MRSPRVWGALSIAVALVAAPGPGHGQDAGSSVSLAIDPCIDTDPDEVRRLLLIELGTSMPEGPPQIQGAVTRIELSCAGDLVELQVHDPVTGKSLIRRIRPGSRRGRERLLALAAMELVVASWIELAATPRPVAPPIDTVLDAGARKSAERVVSERLPVTSRPPGWTSAAVLFGNTAWAGSLHAGLGVRVIRDSAGGFGFAADVTAQTASDDVTLGTVTVQSIGGAGTFHVHRRVAGIRLRAGLGARISAVSMTGMPRSPDAATGGQLTGFTATPLVRLGAELRPVAGLIVALAAEAGYHVLTVRGLVDGRAESQLSGPWLGGQLGVGWTW